jgi:hypothetical protein
MTLRNSQAQAECPTCGRTIRKPVLAAHISKCHNLTKSELCTAAWQRAADVLRESISQRVPARFREPVQEAAINKHILTVVVPYLEKKVRGT